MFSAFYFRRAAQTKSGDQQNKSNTNSGDFNSFKRPADTDDYAYPAMSADASQGYVYPDHVVPQSTGSQYVDGYLSPQITVGRYLTPGPMGEASPSDTPPHTYMEVLPPDENSRDESGSPTYEVPYAHMRLKRFFQNKFTKRQQQPDRPPQPPPRKPLESLTNV